MVLILLPKEKPILSVEFVLNNPIKDTTLTIKAKTKHIETQTGTLLKVFSTIKLKKLRIPKYL